MKLEMLERSNYIHYDNGSLWDFRITDLPEEIERLGRPETIVVSFYILNDNPETIHAKLYKRLRTLCKKTGYELWEDKEEKCYLMLRNI